MYSSSFQGYPKIKEEWTGDTKLSLENADPNNWKWMPPEGVWEEAQQEWQELSNEWFGAATAPEVGSSLPIKIEILQSNKERPKSIFVRESYIWMFNHIWTRAMATGGETGTVIIGQPGIGKTLFLYCLLLLLLLRRQIVLFSLDGHELFLFYNYRVYCTSVKDIARAPQLKLPRKTPSTSKVFIWSLFDIEEKAEPMNCLYKAPCLPIQTASPGPVRYNVWSKQYSPMQAGLPLWTRDELAQGLKSQNHYNDLLDALQWNPSQGGGDPLDRFPCIRELLDARLRPADGDDDVLALCNNDDVLASGSGDNVVTVPSSVTATVSPSHEEAVDYLLDTAIQRFGYSARDVYLAIFDCFTITCNHERAFQIGYNQLTDAVSAIVSGQNADANVSNRIIAMKPKYFDKFFSPVYWEVDFKSNWVARNVLRKLGQVEDTRIRQIISYFRDIPQTRDFARRFLEPLAHNLIAESAGGSWPLLDMVSDNANTPHFALSPSSLVAVEFAQVKRETVIFTNDDISTCLQNGVYYIPGDPNFPLFDAFTIDLDHSKKSAILWVLQMTMSRSYGGSAEGYVRVRQIVARLKKLLVDDQPPLRKNVKVVDGQSASTPQVQVRYLLVAPNDAKELVWRFPEGWNQNCIVHDHRGGVYCLEIPVSSTNFVGRR